MLKQNPTALKLAINRANLQSLGPEFQVIALGNVLRALPTYLYGQAPVSTDSYVSASSAAIVLPDDAKALYSGNGGIISAYARAGSGTAGPLTIDASSGTAPASGHCSVAPNGDLQFNLGTDAWTSVDVVYVPQKLDIYEETLPVVSNLLTLPTSFGNAVLLLEAESKVGTLVAKMKIQLPAASVTTGQSSLNLAKTGVNFASADAVTSARVKFGVVPAIDLNALLEAASNFI